MRFEVLTDKWGHVFDKGTIVTLVRRESDTLARYEDVKTGTRQVLFDSEVEPILGHGVTTLGTDPMWKKRSYVLTSDHNQVANKDKTPKEEAKTGELPEHQGGNHEG